MLRHNTNQKYIVLDFETEGLNLCIHRPWQASYIVCQGNKIVSEQDSYIFWKDLRITKEAKIKTRFDQSKYNLLAIKGDVVANDLKKYLHNKEYRIIFHNGLGYDVYMYANLLKYALGENQADWSFINRCIDTHCLARAFFTSDTKPIGSNILSWQYKHLNNRIRGVRTNLEHLCNVFGIPYDRNKLHDGVYDIKLTYEVFKKLIWKIDI